MKNFCQKDYIHKLGFGSTTIASHGCKLTSFASITGINPVQLNEQFKKDGAFSKDLLIDSEIAVSLGITFEGVKSANPGKVCVVEVDMSKKEGKQQHFCVFLNDGTIMDPWTGTIRPVSTYPIINYRVFNFDKYLGEKKVKEKPMNKDLVKILGEVCGKDFGKDLNESEQKEAANLLKKIKEEIAQNQILSQTNQSLYEENIRLTDKLASVPKEQVVLTFDPVTKGKISKGAAISIGAGTLTYLIQSISGMDYGVYTPMIVVICGIAINTLKEYVTGR